MFETVICDRGETKNRNQNPGVTGSETRKQAETRTAQAETRTAQAKTRTELAETRTEQAETRTELAKTRTEQAEIRAEQAETRAERAETRAEQAETRTELAELRTRQVETALERVVQEEVHLLPETSTRLLKNSPLQEIADRSSPLEKLTGRQREVLQLIAKSQNTKQIAEILKVSPKTVEYHRMKLMKCLNVYDIPGLVRFALRVGLLPPGS
jgi:DNA-binding CsgD family transcriptional regulator